MGQDDAGDETGGHGTTGHASVASLAQADGSLRQKRFLQGQAMPKWIKGISRDLRKRLDRARNAGHRKSKEISRDHATPEPASASKFDLRPLRRFRKKNSPLPPLGDNSVVLNWESPAVPTSVRKPWEQYEMTLWDHVDDQLANARPEDDSYIAHLKQLNVVQNRGSMVAFAALSQKEQSWYMAVSIHELATYVNWRQGQPACSDDPATLGLISKLRTQRTFDGLGLEQKKLWLAPGDPCAKLLADGQFAPLVAVLDRLQKS